MLKMRKSLRGKEGLESIKQQQPTANLLAGKTDQIE